ncbi:hypothetical protein BG015_000856 [Linnemannia schmuckeri]|uniref:F-box domain-containing protein n=1 Tax=Linnemannia schmuckeri TaxID=64567 RepID=A0A9P5V6U6_9FUNG|nr:hypothetical protein BG015_000856 [Linnemannia schmuckeri]
MMDSMTEMGARTGQETLPCNRVFNIPELLALLVFHLNNDTNDNNGSGEESKSLRVLVNVCRLWHSFFAPYVWKEVTLSGPSNHKRLSGFLRYRTYIHTLTCREVTKETFKALTHPNSHNNNNSNNTFTNLRTLHLALDRNSIWVTYTLLETFFLHIHSRLSTVSIKFDSTVLDTRLLWSLSQLPFLENLRLETVWCSRRVLGLSDLCREILVCCEGLRSFRMESSYTYRDYVPRLVRLKKAFQGKIMRRFERRVPATVEEAVGRRQGGGTTSKSRNFSPSTAQRQPALGSRDSFLILRTDSDSNGRSSNSNTSSRSKLRRLQLRNCSFDTIIFSDIVKQALRLEELDLQTLFYRGSFDALGIVSQHCRNLRTLRLSGRNDGMSIEAIAKLFMSLPHLEAFYMVLNNSELPAWQSLDTHLLAEYKRQQGQECGGHHHRHPLKTLSIKGYYKETLTNLLEILSLHSLALETLSMGSPWFFQIFVEHTPGNLHSPFAPLVDRQTPSRELFSRPWSTLKDSLVRLDMSTTILVDQEVAGSFFVRLQELRNLRALYVSARHVQDWFPKNFIVTLPPPPTLLSLGKSNNDNNGNSSSGNNGGIGYRTIDRDYITRHLPTGNHCFPALRDVIVRGEDRNVPVPFEITLSEVVFLIAAMPCLEYLYLKAGSVSKTTFGSLKRAFPEYFMMIPRERLDWIDERAD